MYAILVFGYLDIYYGLYYFIMLVRLEIELASAE